ncbi:hypothetical protein [Urechidicola croceus]|uniref:Outer membrane protein beta-barrel domain-containing protein n=1 Tax=Urechidicola croceus TaxID=1850246 RepID=A0A1D8PB24_9FLAO|nr:hypothetical protein [Urechidicola croceus]AOW21763.1 hypothetical protein LPB138_14220 [Urechidicola croceus]
MKNTLLIIGFLILTSLTITAQNFSENAIGLRFGDNDGIGGEISYQHMLNETNRLEVDLGLRNNSNRTAYKLTGIYQWVWELGDGFNWYAGAGGGLGSWKNKDIDESETLLFAAGNIGIEFNLDIPLLISLDYRPEIGFNDIYDGLNSDIALALRYQF